MEYPDNYQQSVDIGKKAIERLSEFGIAWTPRNFTIWYEYCSGRSPALSRILDLLCDSGAEFSDARNDEIYRQFFAPAGDPGQEQEWTRRIEAAADKIIEAIASVGEGTVTYGRALQDFSGNVADASTAEDLTTLITGMLGETKGMTRQIDELQTKVRETGAEVSELREKLAYAELASKTDGLTHTANRRHFDEALRDAAANSVENGEALSLVMADLDHFKTLNDKYGHQVGDQVLKIVGKTMVQCVKGQDTVARYGGEEFAVILPNTDATGAAALAERIRETISKKKLVKKGTDVDIGPITISLGVTAYVPGEPLGDFVERADRALYSAKRAGRNRVGSETHRDKVA